MTNRYEVTKEIEDIGDLAYNLTFILHRLGIMDLDEWQKFDEYIWVRRLLGYD